MTTETKTDKRISALPRSVRDLLDGVKYTIDYYQREYKWETKQVQELLQDLESRFLASYDEKHERKQVAGYASYFLGSVVISNRDGQKFIIDGQQRLTSLTLLLIYLNRLQQSHSQQVSVNNLIFSEEFGEKSFNLIIPERLQCMEAIYNGYPFDPTGKPEAVRNLYARYRDIEDLFPDSLKDKALPYFIDWLRGKVDLIEITAYSDEEAYTIFETMNDRGLSLTPTEMLKGFLLANISDPIQKDQAIDLWKKRLLELLEMGKDEEADFFKAWLRAKYAENIRERKKGAVNKDFDIIGTTFHKWVRDKKKLIGLEAGSDYRDFVMNRFDKFSRHYIRVRQAARRFNPDLEYVYYNSHNNFTLQYPLILAPLKPEDDLDTANRKIRLVAGFIDIFIARRAVNYHTLDYSSIVYTMFNLMKEIRDLELDVLAALLKQKVTEMEDTFDGIKNFGLNLWSKRYIHHILARLTYHIEKQSGIPSSFENYVSREIQKPFEIEHIWADKPDRHLAEFPDKADFEAHRNRIGGLILLQRGFNQSLNDDTYDKKVKAYFGQNLLARSLNDQCYTNNPSFQAYIKQSGLPFKPHPQFNKADLYERQELYRQLCEEIWSPSRFDRELS